MPKSSMIKVRCDDEDHRIGLCNKGFVVLHDHNALRDYNLSLLGGSLSSCFYYVENFLISHLDENRPEHIKLARAILRGTALFDGVPIVTSKPDIFVFIENGKNVISWLDVLVVEKFAQCSYRCSENIRLNSGLINIAVPNATSWMEISRYGKDAITRIKVDIPWWWYDRIYLKDRAIYKGNLVIDIRKWNTPKAELLILKQTYAKNRDDAYSSFQLCWIPHLKHQRYWQVPSYSSNGLKTWS